MKLSEVRLAVLAFASCHSAAVAQQVVLGVRTPDPPVWIGDQGYGATYSTAQAVCDARAQILGYPAGTTTFVKDAGVEHRGKCVPTVVGIGSSASAQPFLGQKCPDNYFIQNWVEKSISGSHVVYHGPAQYCKTSSPVIDRWHDKPQQQCQPKGGNPVFPLTGTKRQSESLLNWSPGAAPLSVTFDNRRKLPNGDPEGAFAGTPAPSFGGLWESSLHKRLVIQLGQSPTAHYRHIQASRGSGAWVSFIRRTSSGSVPQTPDSDIADRIAAGSGGHHYIDTTAQALEVYTSSGVLTSIRYARGGTVAYVYSDSTTPVAVAPVAGLLIKIQDQYGRAVSFEYEQPAGVTVPRIVRIVDADGLAIQVDYDDAGNLAQLAWPDGHARKFLYEQGGLPWALTGIVDENGERYSTYAYDTEGRALSTEYAGGVNRYSLAYGHPPRWVTTETFDSTSNVFWRDHNWQAPQDAVMTTPNHTTVALGATLVNGMPRVTTRSQPAGAGCDASSSSLAYDANGNVTSKTDFNGTKTCHAYDLSRNLETARLEGFAGADACPTDIVAQEIAAGTVQRKTLTQWHPDWSLPVKKAEPGKITTTVYNSQPDPTAGNAIAACAPTTATLPDGKRIVVLCKKVEQATTDATGTLGFSAALAGTPRTWTYTYNEHGQLLTARDPLNNLTTYTYHTETTADFTKGDLKSVTNPASHASQYTRYDKSGRLLESVDANGTKTETTYTPRGWVKTVTTTPPGAPAQATVYDYDGVGQLKKATLSDGTALEYTYDAAHRLRSIKDAAGNAVTYTLDNIGNRTGEELKDASGTLARNITRVYDALNRVQQLTGGTQ
jgi:YD repeat-containing protein